MREACGVIALVFLGLVVVSASTPCVTRESTSCVWHADLQGEGKGLSFIDVGGWKVYSWVPGLWK